MLYYTIHLNTYILRFLFNIKKSLMILIIGTLIQIYPIRKRFVGGKRLNGADYSALTF